MGEHIIIWRPIGSPHSYLSLPNPTNNPTNNPTLHPQIGSCSGLTVLSLRGNLLAALPDSMGCMSRLRVLNISNNRLHHLPYTLVKLQELQSLWLVENQVRGAPRTGRCGGSRTLNRPPFGRLRDPPTSLAPKPG